MDPVSGASYFFNLKTGETSEEHPNMRVARATERKERLKAEVNLGDRLARLQRYVEELEASLAGQLEQLDAAAQVELRMSTAAWRRACCYPTYFRAERERGNSSDQQPATRPATPRY